MVRHILLFSLKNEAAENAVEELKNTFLEIPRIIDGVVSVEWGVNNSPENKNEGYCYCVLMTFRDEAARNAYLPHPAHIRLKDIFIPLLQKIIVFDYEKTH